MKIGVPQGLLYPRYRAFIHTFLEELGAEVVVSPPTNKTILDLGTAFCVDDACLPIKVFHGHVAYLRDKCDMILIPRLIGLREGEFICPMFCGLIDMITHSIPNLPPLIDTPLRSADFPRLIQWARKAGSPLIKDEGKLEAALCKALSQYRSAPKGFRDKGYQWTVALIGHAYNIHDSFVNMNLKHKLNELGVGVITADHVPKVYIDAQVGKLYKKPFWTFARQYYGAAVSLCRQGKVDGVVYVSSFACGIDSVVTELIRCELDDFPLLVLKLDEHTGQAGVYTRLEAFADMLKRRCTIGHHLP